jgi:hypothetical protein
MILHASVFYLGKRWETGENTVGNVIFLHVGPAKFQGSPKMIQAVFDGSVYAAPCINTPGCSRIQTSAIELQSS